MTSHIGYRSAYLDLTLVQSEGQSQGHAHLQLQISLKRSQIAQTLILPSNVMSHMCFSISIFIVDLGLFIIKDNLVSGTVSSQIFWHSCYCSITMQSAACARDYLRIVFGRWITKMYNF